MKKSLLNLINDPKAVIFLDIDGTLTAYECGERNHNACPDEEWESYLNENNPYETLQPLKTMQRWLQEKTNNDKKISERIFVCTVVSGEREIEVKRNFIKRHFSQIPQNHVMYVYHQKDKILILKEVHNCLFRDLDPKYIVMIDDTAAVLTEIQNRSEYTTVHISSFVDIYVT